MAGARAASRGVLRLMARSGALHGAGVDLRGNVSTRRARDLSGLQPGGMTFQGWRDGESRAVAALAGLPAVGGESSGTMKSSWERPGGGGLHPGLVARCISANGKQNQGTTSTGH